MKQKPIGRQEGLSWAAAKRANPLALPSPMDIILAAEARRMAPPCCEHAFEINYTKAGAVECVRCGRSVNDAIADQQRRGEQ